MRFFIACPANCVTGGTELLHQLSWQLSNRGIENYMLYRDASPVFSPTADVFAKYQVNYVTYFVNDGRSVLVLPETMIDMIDICTKGIVMIWWLSVDNYITQYREKICQEGQLDIFGLKGRSGLIHFVQSRYAYEFIKKTFSVEKAFYLKDYINDDIANIALQYSKQTPRENICLYNPKKGAENLKDIRNKCRGDIQWIPLSGLRPEQMAMLLCGAKVYIDFGNHPGKDRIPREAAVCGCCIITNREGSAAYSEDVGIPEEYKLSDMSDYEKVLDTLYDLVDNYDERVKRYETYVASILSEKEEFEKEVDDMLDIVSANCVDSNYSWEENRYDELMDSMQDMVSKIYSYYENAKNLYAAEEIEASIHELLKVESCLSVLREAGYMIIDDILKM